MNWVDLLLIAYVVRAMVLGWRRGLGAEVSGLLAVVLAVTLVHQYLPPLAARLPKLIPLPPVVCQTHLGAA